MGSVGEIVVIGLVGILAAVTAGSLLQLPHGAIRSLAFPRLQILVLAGLLAVAAPFAAEGRMLGILLALLAGVAAVQLSQILRFTPVWPRQSPDADAGQSAAIDSHVTLLAANVKMSNRAYHRLVQLVHDADPDILMAIETDAPWVEALGMLAEALPHAVEVPHSNGYGMVLRSRLPLEGPEVRELLVEAVPSIRTAVRLPSGRVFRLYVVHPEPPVPGHDSKGRDAEIGMVGLEAEDDPLPAVVAGDLNDVAWSNTTRRFQRLSGLLDPRIGRGFFNTFDVRYPFLRWPLDHLFHDPVFRILDMRRMPNIGSDHFPMLFKLVHAGGPAGDEPEASTAEEEAEIREMARKERRTDREAIGSDWEDD